MSSLGQPVTNDQLIQHRLKVLEEIGVGARETERRVDGLALTLAQVEKTVTETQTEMRTRDERTHASLARLHARLDEVVQADAREAGREAGRHEAQTRTWKVVAYSVTATIALGGLAVGVLQLALS